MKRSAIFYFGCLIFLLLTGLSACKRDDPKPDTTIKDVDGNTYTSVKIGTQTWMVENLKVTRYRNGDAIPNTTDQTQWSNLASGGYCNMSNDPSTANLNGRLYNWYTTNDLRKIAPIGWHVPTDEEWTTLITYLGGENNAGGKIKATGSDHWCNPNIGATNESGFTGLPGGVRTDLLFLPGCEWGSWWSSTEFDVTTAYNRIIFDSDTQANRVNNDKRFGMSIRCIKD